jgi:phage-related protein
MASVADLIIRVNTDSNKAIKALFSVKGAIIALGPAAVPATAAVMGIAAGATAAGTAVGAFALAAKPAVEEVTNAFKLQEAAIAASAQGGAAATAAQKKYNDAVKQLSTPQKDLLTQFNGLNTEYKAWSKGLQSTTLPVFTKGIGVLRTLLPMLTPFVKSAGAALSSFVDQLGAGAKSAGFKQFMTDLANFSGPALTNFLNSIKNVGVGFAGLISAFLPQSAKMTGGLEKATAAFARWGQALKGSSGFAKFTQAANLGGTALGQLGKALVQLVVDLKPLITAATGIVTVFAQIVANTPVPVLVAIGKAILYTKLAILGATLATKAWAIATRIAAAVQLAWRTASFVTAALMPTITAGFGAWAASIWASTAALLANPITWIVIGIIALVAAIVLIATKTTWFQTAWKAMTDAIGVAWDWISGKLSQGFEWLKNLFLNWTGPGLILKHWTTIKTKTIEIWNAIKTFVATKIDNLKTSVTTKFNTVKTYVTTAWDYIKNKITTAIADAKKAVIDKIVAIVQKVRDIKASVKNALSGAASWLINAGKNIIQGLIDGILSKATAIKDAVGGVIQGARNLLPFSPAKEGPLSGRGYTLYSGQAMMKDWARGMQQRSNLPVQAAGKVAAGAMKATRPATTPWLSMAGAPGAVAGAAAGGQAPIQLYIDSSGSPMDELLLSMLQKAIRARGGNVQVVLGRKGK